MHNLNSKIKYQNVKLRNFLFIKILSLIFPVVLLQGYLISVMPTCSASFFFSSANQPRLKDGFPTSLPTGQAGGND